MRIRMVRPNRGSRGATALSRELGIRRLRLVHTSFRPRPNDLLLNWGSSHNPFPEWSARWINFPNEVGKVCNKLLAFCAMEVAGAPCVPFTGNVETAAEWAREGSVVVARTVLNGHSGRGIILVEPGDPLPYAPLYTKYIKKRDEYRVHVMDGTIIDVQHKRRRSGFEGRNNQIRNHGNGWVYCRGGVHETPECVQDAALRAFGAFDLDFAAVDIGYNAHYGEARVYELNTAPGLEGTTLTSYANGLRRLIDALRG